MGSLDKSPGSNWVQASGGLPAYIEKIAKSLHAKRGFTISRSIATAVSMCKRWAAGGEDVNPDTRAKAAAAIAEWEAKRAAARGRAVDMSHTGALDHVDLSAVDADLEQLDLAYGDHKPPYDWKHGYKPISPQAMRVKAKKEKSPNSGKRRRVAGEAPSKGRTPAQTKAADDAQRGRGVAGADTGPVATRPAQLAKKAAASRRTAEAEGVRESDTPKRRSIIPDPPTTPPSKRFESDRDRQAREKAVADEARRGRERRGEQPRERTPSAPSKTPTIAAVSSTDARPSRRPADTTPARATPAEQDAERRAAASTSGMRPEDMSPEQAAAELKRLGAINPTTMQGRRTKANRIAAVRKRAPGPEMQRQQQDRDQEASLAKARERNAKARRDRDEVAAQNRRDRAPVDGRTEDNQKVIEARADRARLAAEAKARAGLADNDKARADLDKREAESKAAVARADKARAANNDATELRAAAADLRKHNRNLYADQLERRAQVIEGSRDVGSDPKALTPATVGRMSDAQLEKTLDRLADAGDFSSPAFKAVEAEQAKREDAKAAARRAEGNRPRR